MVGGRRQLMIHAINAYDYETEKLNFSIEIASEQEARLAEIMGWKEPEDAIYEYDLSKEQIDQIETLVGKRFYDSSCVFQLTCYA